VAVETAGLSSLVSLLERQRERDDRERERAAAAQRKNGKIIILKERERVSIPHIYI
jgi:hypothetical protein